MTATLSQLNLVLDILLKLIFLGLAFYAVLILRKLDDLVESAERSAESIEETSQKIGKLVSVSRYMPFMGGSRDE